MASRAAASGSRSAQTRGGGGALVARCSGGSSSRFLAALMQRSQRGASRCAARPWKPLVPSSCGTVQGMALAAATRAESGMSRPGATSRFCASESRSSQSSRTAASWRRSRIWCSPEVLRHGSTRGGARPASRMAANSCSAYSSFPSACEQFDEFLTQLGEDLDVEGRVAQPGFGQRAGGPVGGGVFLRESEARGAAR